MNLAAPETFPEGEPSLIARDIRKKYAQELDTRLQTQAIASPIRDLTIMVRNTQAELRSQGLEAEADKIFNLTIGDIDPKSFALDGAPMLAGELGFDPKGKIFKEIEIAKTNSRIAEWKTEAEIGTMYQPSALGGRKLRGYFVDFLANYGAPYSVDETLIHYGGLGEAEETIDTLQIPSLLAFGAGDMVDALQKRVTFLAPTPGFPLIHSDAKHAGMKFVPVETVPRVGYCPTPESIRSVLAEDKSPTPLLYLTPMNNPTSTVYDVKTLRRTLDTFHTLRPDGFILVDFAYLEQIPQKQGKAIVQTFVETGAVDQAIMMVSMSKTFGMTGLRAAALYVKNKELFHELQGISQITLASISTPTQEEAVARWEYVTPLARKRMFEHLQKRQQGFVRRMEAINQQRLKRFQTPVIDLNELYQQVPMYVYAKIPTGLSVLDVFVETGICGVPGEVFGDKPANNMARFSMGIAPLARPIA